MSHAAPKRSVNVFLLRRAVIETQAGLAALGAAVARDFEQVSDHMQNTRVLQADLATRVERLEGLMRQLADTFLDVETETAPAPAVPGVTPYGD